MADSSAAVPLTLSLLRSLHPPASGSTRSWQSSPHPDPSIPLLATASADKSVNIYSLRDFSLVSTISGGHKRSVRTVAWKDFGHQSNKRAREQRKKPPVVLGTGSFDANVGIWQWNDSRRRQLVPDDDDRGDEQSDGRGGAAAGMDEIDMTIDDEDENEEWHFSTLLTGPDSEIKSIDFSPYHYPANLLATSSRDKSVWIWEEVDDEIYETIAVLSEHTGDVKSVSWCTGAKSRRKGVKKRKVQKVGEDVDMSEGDSNVQVNGTASGTSQPSANEGDDDEDDILGARPILASGSYDDTIRLWRDVEEEGDWICVAVIAKHAGTVWDLKWESYINYALLNLPPSLSPEKEQATIREFELDWQPRIISCSDDLTVRTWRRELSAQEAERRRGNVQQGSIPTGFASSRIPSVIRPMSAMENWVEDATLPQVHVRSVYAVDWSKRTGLVVSCGGDGTIAVYREVPLASSPPGETNGTGDVVMNGTATAQPNSTAGENNGLAYTLHATTWTVVAITEGAHDEYEINHVCWAERRDAGRRFEGEEMIVSTGDEGDVRIWTLPDEVLRELEV